MQVSQVNPPPERQFNHNNYTLIKFLGQGGFCDVYQATQKNTNKTVAIKILDLDPKSTPKEKQKKIDRFNRETNLCAKIHHPNIVSLLDKGFVNDAIFAVYDYVPGKTLKEEIKERGPLPAPEAAELMGQILDALACAHSLGIVHRDLKPANIMISATGTRKQTKLLDFGIAAFTPQTRDQDYKNITLTREAIGTPTYSAPEQLRGEAPNYKTDLYSWGLLFIECLTGQPAITGNSIAAVFSKQLSPTNVPLPPFLAGHPVAELLRRVLNKNLNERCGDAKEIHHSLKSLNFQNLVSPLLKVSTQNSQQDENPTLETQVDTAPAFFSDQIQRKQISTLSLILSIENNHSEEELDQEIIDAIHNDQKTQCTDIASRYHGTFAGSLGDTLLFHFGYPNASDNDCRLCVRAALDIMSYLRKRNEASKNTLGASSYTAMGIHTGMVTTTSDTMPSGNSINVAMKLARVANNNQIFCSETTQKILEPYIEFEPIPYKAIKQLRDLPIYSLRAEKQHESYGFLRSTGTQHALVGREKELTLLSSSLNSTDELSRFFHIHGEAGIGKSRILLEFRNLAKDTKQYIAQCLPENKYNALHPILNLVRHKYALQIKNTADAIQALEDILKPQIPEADLNNSMAILCSWLSLELPDGLTMPAMPADGQKALLFAALTTLLCFEKEIQNAIFIIEDIHWSDPTTLEFIHFLLNSPNFSKFKHSLISTSRLTLPEQIIEDKVQVVAVSRLQQNQSAQLINNLFENTPVAEEVIEEVIARTDGIPLFIEELTNMLKQKQIVHLRNGVIHFTDVKKLKEIPSTLRDSLQQKLDELEHAKESAQLAATIGREFDYELLASSVNKEDEVIQRDLNELLQADLILLQRKTRCDSYIFKHALVRDAAYDSMSNASRIRAHEHVASSIEESADLSAGDTLGLLSYHYGESENSQKCGHYSDLSAKDAMSKSTYSQAKYYAQKALGAYSHLEDSHNQQLEVNQVMVTATMMTEGMGADGVEKAINKSLEILKQCKQQSVDVGFHTFWSLATYNNVRGFHNKVHEIIDTAISGSNLDSGQKAALYALKAHTTWMQGDLRTSLHYVNESLSLYDPVTHKNHAEKFGHDSRVMATGLKGLIYSFIGDYEKANAASIQAVKMAEELKSLHSICMSKLYLCCCLYQQNKSEQIPKLAREIFEICEAQNMANWRPTVSIFHGWSIGNPEMAREGLKKRIAAGATQMQALWTALIVDSDIQNKNYALALETTQKTIKQAEEFGDYLFIPELLRLQAICYKHQNQIKAAEDCLALALSKAEKLGLQRFKEKVPTQVTA